MIPKLISRQNTVTPFVQLDTGKCKACWTCLEGCKKNVLGKVDLPWHKHALVINPDKCSGCLMCIKVCQYNAFSGIDREKREAEKHRKRIINNFIITNLLLFLGVAVILSGLILQLGFHIGGDEENHKDAHIVSSQPLQYEHLRATNTNKTVYGLYYHDWSTTHKLAITFFSFLMVYHMYAHYKWYRSVIYKNLIRKNIQVVTLTCLLLLTAVTGLVPWFIDLSGSTSILRWVFIEIHDKFALILIVYLVLHVIGRYTWFSKTYSMLNPHRKP